MLPLSRFRVAACGRPRCRRGAGWASSLRHLQRHQCRCGQPGPFSAVLPSAESPVSQRGQLARQRWPQPGTRDLHGDEQGVHHDRARTWPPPVTPDNWPPAAAETGAYFRRYTGPRILATYFQYLRAAWRPGRPDPPRGVGFPSAGFWQPRVSLKLAPVAGLCPNSDVNFQIYCLFRRPKGDRVPGRGRGLRHQQGSFAECSCADRTRSRASPSA
jgi:hypothetical protein